MTRVGAIDCGTNSIRLLVADVDPVAGTLTDVVRLMRVVRLGEGVDRTGRLAPAALQRTFAATADYARLCRENDVQRIRFVATSASRDAENRDEFVRGVRDLIGVEPQVVPGSEEAALSFAGSTRELVADGLTGPFLVADIGGGSTEIVRGGSPSVTAPGPMRGPSRGPDGSGPVEAAQVEAALSVDVGCVRLTERHLLDDPPSPAQVAAARADVEQALDRVAEVVPLQGVSTLVGLAGSVTTITAYVLGLSTYDADRIHRRRLPVHEVREGCDRLLHMPRAERAALPFMHPGRVDVIGGGALVWRCIVDRLVETSGLSEVVTSEHDILDGIAFGLA